MTKWCKLNDTVAHAKHRRVSDLVIAACSRDYTCGMRILYTNFHQGSGIGGHSIYILSLAQAMADKHEIAVAVPESSGLFRRAQALPNVHVVAQSFPNRPADAWRAAKRLRALLRQRRIDVVHVNGSADHRLVMLARFGMGSKKPAVVFTKHNDQPISNFSAAVRSWLGTSHVIAVCDFVRRRVARSPYRLVGITAIPNGIDTQHFSQESTLADASRRQMRDAFRQTWLASVAGVPQGLTTPGMLVIGSQAGTDSYKGWMDLVHAVAQLPVASKARVVIVLAGAWPSEAQKAEVAQVGMQDQVHFAGPQDDVRPFLGSLDAGFVLSWRVETISFACREMMSMGLPVMVSDHGGLAENITSGVDGWVVAERDLDAIGKCVQTMLDQPDLLEKIGNGALLRARAEFGLDKFVNATEAVYKQVTPRP